MIEKFADAHGIGRFAQLGVSSDGPYVPPCDEEGLQNCATGLRPLLPLAAELGLTLCMEQLNSKIDHPDYECDRSAWGVAPCKELDSANFGLLYDTYHMQIMEGDIIRTIRGNHRWFTHYHTGGCPGRNEIDDTQELNYPAIMRAIADKTAREFWNEVEQRGY